MTSTARRRKILQVDEGWILTIFQMVANGRAYDVMRLPALRDAIPDGASILGVHYDHDRRTFDVALSHDSFDPVPENEVTPRIDLHGEIEIAVDRDAGTKFLEHAVLRLAHIVISVRDPATSIVLALRNGDYQKARDMAQRFDEARARSVQIVPINADHTAASVVAAIAAINSRAE